MPSGSTGSWKLFWEKSQEIQQAFNSKVKYPPGGHAIAWSRFNSFRDAAKRNREQQDKLLSTESSKLDDAIDQFCRLVNNATTPFTSLTFRYVEAPIDLLGTCIHDWRPVWGQAKEIQGIFSSGRRLYPNKQMHDQAWTKFNDARNQASEHARAEHEAARDKSSRWRDLIVNEAESARYSAIREMYSLGSTDADDMKKMGQWLKHAGEMLSNNKQNMIKEHKDLCFERIREIRATHDQFWGAYKEAGELRHREFVQRMTTKLEKIENNIRENYARKAKCESELLRVEDNIERLEGLIASAYSDSYREAHEGFLAQAEEKRRSVVESIDQVEGWIEQAKADRSDIASKLK